ncbi:MAG: hypothetical protein CL685_02870 [Candidatus Magasanikbacteria bacterium]|nr:hypothetical protein [Candidatus Magasanikbacteria bacterium]|tara:strand:- start:1047 stop:2171 length:1125 start_codon:yes stop_codon:yes gene_type:complete
MAHNHHYLHYFFLKTHLRQIYTFVGLHAFAASMVGLFVPLYLHVELGFSLSVVLLFFIIQKIVLSLVTPLAALCATKIGTKHTVLVSLPGSAITIGLLYLLRIYSTPLWLIASISGSSIAFLWFGLHTSFVFSSHKKHRGEEMGKRVGAAMVAGMFAPALGGFIISIFGFGSLFLFYILLLFLSGVVLLHNGDYKPQYTFSLTRFSRSIHWPYAVYYVARGMEISAGSILWPLFIYSILTDYLSLGFVGFLVSCISGILFYIVGKRSDKTKKRTIARLCMPFRLLCWVFRAAVSLPIHVFLASGFAGFVYGISSPLSSMQYDNADKKNIYDYFIYRELFLGIGKVSVLLFFLLTQNFAGAFLWTGFAQIAIFLF